MTSPSIAAFRSALAGALSLLLMLFLLGCDDPDSTADQDEVARMLAEFENRKRYSVLDVETLGSIDDDHLEQAIIDYIDYKVAGRYEDEYRIVTGLSKGFQAIYATWWVEAEVKNGGFHQYFWNSSGQFAMEAIEGFNAIGAPAMAGVMEDAVRMAIAEMPEMNKFREEGTIEAFAESYEHTNLGTLDTRFDEQDDDLSSLRIAYIRRNPELFVGD